MLVTAGLLMGVTLLAASLLRPKKPSATKADTYECGMETVGDTWVQFRVQYYIFALVFVLFDVEAILLFPIAVAYNALAVLCRADCGLVHCHLAGSHRICLAQGRVAVELSRPSSRLACFA